MTSIWKKIDGFLAGPQYNMDGSVDPDKLVESGKLGWASTEYDRLKAAQMEAHPESYPGLQTRTPWDKLVGQILQGLDSQKRFDESVDEATRTNSKETNQEFYDRHNKKRRAGEGSNTSQSGPENQAQTWLREQKVQEGQLAAYNKALYDAKTQLKDAKADSHGDLALESYHVAEGLEKLHKLQEVHGPAVEAIRKSLLEGRIKFNEQGFKPGRVEKGK